MDETIFFVLLIDTLLYSPLFYTLIKTTYQHFKNTSRAPSYIITKCKKCKSPNLNNIQSTPTAQKKQLSFIIKLIGTLICFIIIFIIIVYTFPKLKKFAINPFYGTLEESGKIHLSPTESILALGLSFSSPLNYIILFFLYLNIIFFFANRAKCGTKEICMICYNCGYINRPQEFEEKSKPEEHIKDDHS